MMIINYLIFITYIVILSACGTANVGEKHESITPEQEAEKLMNEGDFQAAIDILQPLVDEDPEFYSRYPLLASAYAGLSGVDVVSILKAMLSSSGSSSPLTLIMDFIPEDASNETADVLKQGVDLLGEIPAELMGADGDADFGGSAELELVLYRTVYATMLLRLALDFTVDGSIDPDSLNNMTVAQARAILTALRQVGSGGAAGGNAQAVSGDVDAMLDEIDAQEGADDQERLSNYLSNQ